jgi:uncharacterized protein YbbK (DUF523 family)
VFKAKSPSCGVWGIPRYGDDGQAAGRVGPGLYAGRVMAGFPLLAVECGGLVQVLAGRPGDRVSQLLTLARAG